MSSNEILTDNTKIKKYEQCKKCIYWGNDSAFNNAFNKACCEKYPHPDFKPAGIMRNEDKCEFRVTF